MKTNNNKTENKSYGFLSLRNGVFLNTVGSLVISPFIVTTTSSNDYVSRYFNFRVPGMNSSIDGLVVVSVTMNAVGLLGSYKKSKKLIRYYKNYCYYEAVCTPLVVCQTLLSNYWRISAILSEKGASWKSFRDAMKEEYSKYVFVAFGTFLGACFAQTVYAAYVARQYESYLELEAPEKEDY